MNKVVYSFLVGILLNINLSCTNSYNNLSPNDNSIALTYDDFPSSGEIKFEEITPWVYNEPLNIYTQDSILIVCHVRKGCEKWIRVLNKKNGKLLDSFLSIGKGPNEALCLSCSGQRLNSSFWAYDITKKTIWEFDDIIDRKHTSKKKIDLQCYKIEFLNDSTIIGNSSYGTYCKIDKYDLSENKKIGGIGDYESLPENMALAIKKQITTSDIRVKPDGKKIAAVYHSFDLLEIYSDKGELISAIRGPINSSPQFEIKNGELGPFTVTNPKSIFCYTTLFTTNNYIYACFSGEPFLNEKGQPEGELCDKIFVFDWEGNPIKIFKLPSKIMTFCVDETDWTIYSYEYKTGLMVKGKIEM